MKFVEDGMAAMAKAGFTQEECDACRKAACKQDSVWLDHFCEKYMLSGADTSLWPRIEWVLAHGWPKSHVIAYLIGLYSVPEEKAEIALEALPEQTEWLGVENMRTTMQMAAERAKGGDS